MNATVKAITQSVGTALLISIVLGVGVGFIVSAKAGIGSGILGFILQFIISYFVGMIRDSRIKQDVDSIVDSVIANATELRIPIDLSCAYCHIQNNVGLALSVDNSFTCASCNQLNRVFIQYTTARTTIPLNSKESTNEVKMEETQRQTTVNDSIGIE